MQSRVAKVALTGWVTLHLLSILIGPIRQSYVGERVGAWIDWYARPLGFAAGWSFYAPEPGPPPVFIEWEVLGSDNDLVSSGKWPEAPDPFWLRERQNRRIYMTAFMMASEVRAERMMLPYLCRTHPQASAVRLWRAMHSIPPIWEVASGETRPGETQVAQRKWISHSFCPEKES